MYIMYIYIYNVYIYILLYIIDIDLQTLFSRRPSRRKQDSTQFHQIPSEKMLIWLLKKHNDGPEDTVDGNQLSLGESIDRRLE